MTSLAATATRIICRAWPRGLHKAAQKDWHGIVHVHLVVWCRQPWVSSQVAADRLIAQFSEGGAIFSDLDYTDLTQLVVGIFKSIPRPGLHGDGIAVEEARNDCLALSTR